MANRPPFYRRPGSGTIHPVDANVTSILARQPPARVATVARSTTTTGTVVTTPAAPASAPVGTYTAVAPLLLVGTAFQIPPASSSAGGYLLAADWITFNGKEPALGNPSFDGYLLSSTAAGVRSWVPPGGGGGSGGGAYTESFDDSDLVSGMLTVAHDLGNKFPAIAIYDGSDMLTIADSVTGVDANTATIDLSSYLVVDAYTALLLPFDGANGSTTYTDLSPSPQTMTNHGASLSTAQAKFGSASASFNAGTYITGPDIAAYDLGSNDFTIDCWIYPNAIANSPLVVRDSNPGPATAAWLIGLDTGGVVVFSCTSAQGTWDMINISAGSVTTGAWTHIAVVRQGNTFNVYIGGVSVWSGTSSSAIAAGIDILAIGAWPKYGTSYDGYIDELRISNGVARWSSNFTPPTSPYTGAIPGTWHLTAVG